MYIAFLSCCSRAAHFQCIQLKQILFLGTTILYPLDSQEFLGISRKFPEKAGIPQNYFGIREGSSAGCDTPTVGSISTKRGLYRGDFLVPIHQLPVLAKSCGFVQQKHFWFTKKEKRVSPNPACPYRSLTLRFNGRPA